MKKQGLAVPLVGLGLFVFLFLLSREGEELTEQNSPSAKSKTVSPRTAPTAKVEVVGFLEGELVSDLSHHYFKNYGTAEQHPHEDLEEIALLLADYRTVAGPSNPLPTRSNRRIVQFLSGQNPSGFVYLNQEMAAVSSSGELVDRWQNPLYFHFISSEEIEIRSAGKDGIMWTQDDLLAGSKQESSHLTNH